MKHHHASTYAPPTLQLNVNNNLSSNMKKPMNKRIDSSSSSSSSSSLERDTSSLVDTSLYKKIDSNVSIKIDNHQSKGSN
jgi:hypothetical protein